MDNFTPSNEGFNDDASTQNASSVTISAATEKLIERGKAAWISLKRGESWDHWQTVGIAMESARKDIMKSLSINDSHSNSKKLKDKIGIWLKETGFDEIDKASRSRLRSCMEHLSQIEEWRQTLDADERVALNHPNSIWRKYKATTRGASAGKSRSTNTKDEVIRELQEEVDQLTETVNEMAAATDRATTLAREREAELTNALNKVDHEVQRRIAAEERVKKAEAWALETLLTADELATGKPSSTITEEVRERLLKVLAGALHPTATLGQVLAGIRGYHRIAFGYPPDRLCR